MSLLPEIRAQLMDAAGHPRRHRVPVGTVMVAAATLLTVAVAAVFALSLRHSPSRHPAALGVVPGRQALIDELAPLRQPQTAVDRAFARWFGRRARLGPTGAVDSSLVRYVGTTPWGERMFLVPTLPPTRRQIVRLFAGPDGQLSARVHVPFASWKAERVGLFSRGGGGSGATATDLLHYGISLTEGAGRSFAGGATETRVLLAVPDGVAKVTFLFGRQPLLGQYGAPIYRRVTSVTVPVVNNLAAVQVHRQGGATAEIWYAANGNVVQRVGNFAALDRVRGGPHPGPETPLSRAAQKDPSTPNHAWVTPAIGGPHTNFAVHFRVLLNGADYGYEFTGPRCPAFTFPGGTGKPDVVRGELWSDSVRAIQGQALCPGTYHVAVFVMDLGRFGGYRHRARPFGTATFTVR